MYNNNFYYKITRTYAIVLFLLLLFQFVSPGVPAQVVKRKGNKKLVSSFNPPWKSFFLQSFKRKGCIPKVFCGMNSARRHQVQTPITLEDLLVFMDFISRTESNVEVKRREKIKLNIKNLEDLIKTSSQTVADKNNELDEFIYEVRDKLQSEEATDIAKNIRTHPQQHPQTRPRYRPYERYTLFGTVRRLFRFGRSISVENNQFWKTREFDALMKLAAKIGISAKLKDAERVCGKTFKECPFSLEDMHFIFKKSKRWSTKKKLKPEPKRNRVKYRQSQSEDDEQDEA